MEETFTKIVQKVFNNWTALQLAVEHSMGGPNSKQTATEFLNYMVQYCLYEPNVQCENIQDALEDILDQEFETICEDASPREISLILYRFLNLLKEGNMEQCELEYINLPTANTEWLNQQVQNKTTEIVEEESSSDDDSDEKPETKDAEMTEDPGWTQVKTRRKR